MRVLPLNIGSSKRTISADQLHQRYLRSLLDTPADEAGMAKLALVCARKLTPGVYFGPDDLADEGLAFIRSYSMDKGYKVGYPAHVLKPRSNFCSGADTWEPGYAGIGTQRAPWGLS